MLHHDYMKFYELLVCKFASERHFNQYQSSTLQFNLTQHYTTSNYNINIAIQSSRG